jgi:hypothetical protein
MRLGDRIASAVGTIKKYGLTQRAESSREGTYW